MLFSSQLSSLDPEAKYTGWCDTSCKLHEGSAKQFMIVFVIAFSMISKFKINN